MEHLDVTNNENHIVFTRKLCNFILVLRFVGQNV